MIDENRLIEIRDRLKSRVPNDFHQNIHDLINRLKYLIPKLDLLGENLLILPILNVIEKMEKNQCTPSDGVIQFQNILNLVTDLKINLLENAEIHEDKLLKK